MMKTLTNNHTEEVLDDEEVCTKETQHHQDIHHLNDKEAIRQELLDKVCFSSSATVQNRNKKKSCSSRDGGDDGGGGDDVTGHQHDSSHEPHHDDVATDVTRHPRVCRSKHSQRRAVKWRLQQA